MAGTIVERKWPPQCCVPAFVVAALEALGSPVPVPEAMAHVLGVRVGAKDANPYALAIAQTHAELGVSPANAVPRIEEAIAELGAAIVVDDSGEAASRRMTLPFARVIIGARAAGDGFWIFRPQPNSRARPS